MAEEPTLPSSISASGLACSFGAKAAVAGVDFRVAPGETFGLLGPNGAGKTTVVRMLTTLLVPSGGSAAIVGLDVVRQAAQVRRVIGAALQETALDPLMTGHELIRLQAALYGLSRGESRSRAEELLDQFDLASVASSRVRTYSGGTRRRLDLALALLHRPKVLFLDEPTTGIDPASRQVIWEQVRGLNRDHGTTVFLTTQYLEEADRLCDQIAIMDHGVIVRRGHPETLKAAVDLATLQVTVPDGQRERAGVILARFGPTRPGPTSAVSVGLADGPPSVAAAVRALDEAQINIEHLRLDTPTLDDVFAEATGHRIRSGTSEEPNRIGTGDGALRELA